MLHILCLVIEKMWETREFFEKIKELIEVVFLIIEKSLFFEDSETLYNMGFEIWFVFFLFTTILSYQTVDKSNSIE